MPSGEFAVHAEISVMLEMLLSFPVQNMERNSLPMGNLEILSCHKQIMLIKEKKLLPQR